MIRYTQWIEQWRHAILIVCAVAIIAMCAGLRDFSIASNFRAYFSADNPQLIAFEEVESEFSKQDGVFFLIEPREGDLYTPEAMRLIYQLTDRAWTLPMAMRASSLANHQHTSAEDDTLVVEHLLPDLEAAGNPDHIEFIRKLVQGEPILQNLINPEGSAAGVSVVLNLPENDNKASSEVADAAKAVAGELSSEFPNIKVTVGGTAATNAAITDIFHQDTGTLVLATYLVFMVLLWFMLRRLSGMLLTIGIILVTTFSTFGFFTGLGVTITPTQAFVPTAITTIAIADVVHVLVSYYYELEQGRSRREAITESLRINAQPVFITSLSTAIGVLCLNASDSPPYRLLGNMIAFGVGMAWFFSMVLLPALLFVLPTPKHRPLPEGKSPSERLDRFALWVIRHNKTLLVVGGLICVALIANITNNRITERWNEYFDESYEIRQTIDTTNEKLSGVHNVQYTVRSRDGGNGIYAPDYLKQLDQFAEWLRQQPKVGHVESLADTIKDLNRDLHNGDKAYHRIPDSHNAAAQYFLLYEMSLPQGLSLDDRQNMERSASRMSVVVHKSDSEEMLALDRRAVAWAKENAPALDISEGTGLDLVFAHMSGRNIRSLVYGASIGLVLISFVMMFALRSVRLGLISLVPNLVPVAVAYGIWGLMKAEISLSVSVVISISLGIVVDDSVHFLSKYLRARRERGYDTTEAIRYAFRTVGTALVITSVVLVSGFLLLLLAHFNPSADMGTLLALTISLALAADFLLLPPILMALDKRRYKGAPTASTN
ncbi:MAG: efflux RND transporter permease subunit [Pseudomonadota bacterium]